MRPPMIGFRPTFEDQRRIEGLVARLREQEPYREITKADAVRFALHTVASGAMMLLGTPEAQRSSLGASQPRRG